MGDGPLTKEQLDAATAEWLAWRKGLDAPATKSLPPAGALSQHDAALIKGIAAAFHDEIEALKARISELEANALKYCGVYQASIAYRKGNVVTHDGSAWCATRAVSAERPGSSDGWQLMVKHGKDATAASPRSDATTAAHARNGSTLPPSNPRMR